MNKYSLKEISKYIGGEFHGRNTTVSGFSIDSRTINENEVFFCIKGKNFDGHNFIKSSLDKASCIITEVDIDYLDLEKKSYIKVKNTLQALQKTSEFIRYKCKAKFVAITGSNGKTTVKEMLAHILSNYKVSYTKGNLNNNIGVSLTLLSINQDDEFVIVEAGSNNLGEIEPLSKIINPDIAAVTNIGLAHIEGFKSLENTAAEKYSIFNHIKKNGYAVINSEDNFSKFEGHRNKLYFGYKMNLLEKLAKFFKNINYKTFFLTIKDMDNKYFSLNYKRKKKLIKLNLNGEHNFLNASCASSIALLLGISMNEIKEKIETFDGVNSRLKMHNLKKKNLCVIDDCYNANPSSFKAAILFLSKLKGKKIVLMGDMAELGVNSKNYHKEIGEYAIKLGIYKFLSIGNQSQAASDKFRENGLHFRDKESLKTYLIDNIEPSSYILIKGSRNQKLEEIVNFLKKWGE